MTKAAFSSIEGIVNSLTVDEIGAAQKEYEESRVTTNKRIAYLLRETNAYGKNQHMSNEQRLYDRRKITSLQIKHGMPTIWITINPNDLTNEANMRLAACRVATGADAEKLFEDFKKRIGRVQHTVRDAVSSARFFHREIELFFKHLASVQQESIFGKVSCYYGCVETNERGALHLHGLLWLDANIEMPNLFRDLSLQPDGSYVQQVCEYIDSVFSEVGDPSHREQSCSS